MEMQRSLGRWAEQGSGPAVAPQPAAGTPSTLWAQDLRTPGPALRGRPPRARLKKKSVKLHESIQAGLSETPFRTVSFYFPPGEGRGCRATLLWLGRLEAALAPPSTASR